MYYLMSVFFLISVVYFYSNARNAYGLFTEPCGTSVSHLCHICYNPYLGQKKNLVFQAWVSTIKKKNKVTNRLTVEDIFLFNKMWIFAKQNIESPELPLFTSETKIRANYCIQSEQNRCIESTESLSPRVKLTCCAHKQVMVNLCAPSLPLWHRALFSHSCCFLFTMSSRSRGNGVV